MKKNILRAALLAAVMMCSAQSHAQFSDILKNVANSALGAAANSENTATSAVAGIVKSLIGTSSVDANSLVGTWSYTQPCVAFESDNVLTNLGSSAVSGKIEKTLATKLEALKFTSGKIVMTLNEGGKGTISYNGKAKEILWSVEDANLVITFPLLNKSMKINSKLSAGELQLAMDGTKLITFLSSATDKASAISSNLGTVSSLMKTVKGMYVGLKFQKK